MSLADERLGGPRSNPLPTSPHTLRNLHPDFSVPGVRFGWALKLVSCGAGLFSLSSAFHSRPHFPLASMPQGGERAWLWGAVAEGSHSQYRQGVTVALTSSRR